MSTIENATTDFKLAQLALGAVEEFMEWPAIGDTEVGHFERAVDVLGSQDARDLAAALVGLAMMIAGGTDESSERLRELRSIARRLT